MTIRLRGLIVAILISLTCWAGIIGAARGLFSNDRQLEANSQFDGRQDV